VTIKIGEKTLATRRPADLDAQLVAATGCTAAEQVNMLGLRSTPFQVARALRPFLDKEAPPVPELAQMIEGADLVQVRADTVALLSAAAPAEKD
jgi:hypothetical protein